MVQDQTAAVISAIPADTIPIPLGTAAIIPDRPIPAVLVTPVGEAAMVEAAAAAINGALPKS
jgi:hypothetical protein